MAYAFKLQDPGEGIHEVEIEEVLVAKGDKVEEGQSVFVVESDKAAIELPAPVSGTIEKITVSEGDTVKVGSTLMTIASGEDEADEATSEKKEEPEEHKGSEADSGRGHEDKKKTSSSTDDENGDEVEEQTDSKNERGAPDKDKAPDQAADKGVKAAPAARRIAREKGLDLKSVRATGSHGHITREDVERAAKKDSAGGNADDDAQEQRQKLSATRRAIARHMSRAWQEIPHVNHQDKADISDLEEARQVLVSGGDDGATEPTLMAFVMKALCVALSNQPHFNALYDGEKEELILKKQCNLAFALDTPRGLLTPVIRDAGEKSIQVLATEVDQMARRLREGRAESDDLKGGSFTLTNVGAFGGDGFAPIVNHPQVAILGMGRAKPEQIVCGTISDPEIKVRLMLPLVLAFDHRVLDGADAARFMNELKELLSQPYRLFTRLR